MPGVEVVIDSLITKLLPPRPWPPRVQFAVAALLLLFPLAYAAGIALEYRRESQNRVPDAINRGEAIRRAQKFTMDHGVGTGGWRAFVTLGSNKDLLAYYTEALPPEDAPERDLAPANEVRVKLVSPTDRAQQK